MDSNGLNEAYGLAGVLQFEDVDGLVRARVTLPSCEAAVYLQGAHVTAWQPAGEAPVLFLSERSSFAAGKPIRGGVPVCFPWFANRSDGGTGPSHGFARIQDWEVMFAALLPGESDVLRLTFGLGPNALSRSFGFDGFRVVYEMSFGEDEGRTLGLRLTVANTADKPLRFEEALHSYFHVQDVRKVKVVGLEGAAYLDKTDGFKEKHAPADAMVLTGTTDRVFSGHLGAAGIADATLGRKIMVNKVGSRTTVVWNPWAEGSVGVGDLSATGWEGFLCLETANAGADAVTLQPGEAHTMEARVTVGVDG